MSTNAEERVNVQQALFEVESQNEANLWQAEQLEDRLQKSDRLSSGDRFPHPCPSVHSPLSPILRTYEKMPVKAIIQNGGAVERLRVRERSHC